jgi:poly(A) polymerase
LSTESSIDARDSETVPTPLDSASAVASDAPPPEIDPSLLDPDALKVLRHLRRNGHQAYLVGGCVRDLLLGCKPKDFDVATSANPEQVRQTFRNCRLIGRRFRLAHIYFRGQKTIEVATFRKNPGEESVGEEPAPPETDLLISEDNVFGTAEEDARRRDFTINGLFYDVGLGEVIDYVGGRADLEARRICTIGSPEIRLREDPVRALRAIRFAAKLNLTIEPGTWAAIQKQITEIARCAPARVLEETLRLLRCGASARAVQLLREAGALPALLPSVAQFLDQATPVEAERFYALLKVMDDRIQSGLPTDDALLLAALLLRLVRTHGAETAADGGETKTSNPSALATIEPILTELTRTARLPRRIAEGARLLLLAQGALLGERRRRGSPTRFMRSPHFADALVLMAANVQASGEGSEALARWRARESEVAPKSARASSSEAPRHEKRRTANGVESAAVGTFEPFTFESSGLL